MQQALVLAGCVGALGCVGKDWCLCCQLGSSCASWISMQSRAELSSLLAWLAMQEQRGSAVQPPPYPAAAAEEDDPELRAAIQASLQERQR